MRILALNYEFPPLGGGAGNATAHISQELTRLGCEVAVVTAGYGDLPSPETVGGVTVHRVRALRSRLDQSTPLEMASFVLAAAVPVLRIARRFKPEVTHVYFAVPTGPLGLLLKRVMGIPYLLSLRGGDVPGFLPGTLDRLHRWSAPVNRLVWQGAGAIVANSAGLQALAQRSAGRHTVQMVPNGVDIETYAPGAPREGDRLRLLFAGRLVEQKGVRHILEAAAQLRTGPGVPVEVVVVGAGPEEAALRRLAGALGVAQQVRFAGWVSRAAMPQEYRSADVFVLPSYEEGMANVVLEAMASGLPVVTTDIYGNRDLITDQQEGILIPPGDSRALAGALGALAADAGLRRTMGARARARAEQFAWARTAAAYLELSRSLVPGCAAAGAVAGSGG